MPASSKSQQRLFGMVIKCQKSGKCASPEVKKVAKSIKPKDAKDFAKTKHKGLPEKKKKKKKFSEWLEERDPAVFCKAMKPENPRNLSNPKSGMVRQGMQEKKPTVKKNL